MPTALATAIVQHEDAVREAVVSAVSRAADRIPLVRDRLRAADLSPGEVSLEALTSIPVFTKDEAIARQAAGGDPVAGVDPDARVLRWFQSPGPLYEAQVEGSDWRWEQAFLAAGAGPKDVVLNCFSHHLSPAGAMMEQGVHAIGAASVPGGIGSMDLQARAVADLPITGYVGLPSYLKALAEAYVGAGLPTSQWSIRWAVVTAEPLPPSLRWALQQYVPTVLSAYGTAETGLLAHEDGQATGLVPARGVLLQVCDLSDGTPRRDDGQGQLVVTLPEPAQPLLRYGTGDVSAWQLGPDGRARLQGLLGRVGEAIKVKGMFLHPQQIRSAMQAVEGVSAYEFVVGRSDHKDSLTCRVAPLDDQADRDALASRVAELVKSALRFTVRVEVVEPGEVGDVPLRDDRAWD
ncbi:phenylacetate--CoA ligase family protein [Kytococcus sedentarius]|uniref:phenylacetate--CoA ligase family protein n=1 Tax=Kytococcus sedentarius TaxID=1276 RepID=UPI00194FA255|nr:AMP-binding protein [Kytococcus sedentarius]QRO87776.1 phenylacetate--CoA ligase family protein [Kytococcus sedentarius]